METRGTTGNFSAPNANEGYIKSEEEDARYTKRPHLTRKKGGKSSYEDRPIKIIL